jgi:pimeloyl-ACP methyl ester carboxylesterase
LTGPEPIAVRRHGTGGPPVVVLHGGPGAPGSAAGLARDLAPDFRVLEPLQRRAGTLPLTVARHVEDLAAVAPERAAIVGCSWGAMLGLSYAARHPGRVSLLVLVGCGTYDEAGRALLGEALDERLGELGRRRLEEIQERLAGERNPAARDAAFGELGQLVGLAECHQRIEGLEAPGDALPPDHEGFSETWRDVLRLQREGVEPRAFEAIQAPVLMLHGDCDPHPGPATRDLLRRFLPRLEYVGMERCGHEPWRERWARDRFLALLRERLAAT